jgi:hypothetical protein
MPHLTQDPSARKLQDAFEQHCSSFIKEHREELRSIIPDRLAQYEEGLVSVQELMNEAWDARHPA